MAAVIDPEGMGRPDTLRRRKKVAWVFGTVGSTKVRMAKQSQRPMMAGSQLSGLPRKGSRVCPPGNPHFTYAETPLGSCPPATAGACTAERNGGRKEVENGELNELYERRWVELSAAG